MDDDPVIKEVDICLNRDVPPSADERLVLLHFPMSPSKFGEQDLSILSARYKPNLNILQMERQIPEDSPNIDNDVENVDTQRTHLTSTKNKADQNCLVLAIMKNGVLHWVPLHSSLTLKTTFPSQVASSSSEESSRDPNPSEARVVNMRLANVNRPTRENTFYHHQQRSAAEPWVNLNISESGLAAEHVLASSRGLPPNSASSLSKHDLEKALGISCSLSEEGLAKSMQQLLTRVFVVHLTEVLHHFRHTSSEDEIFRCLIRQAFPINGCWVVHSDLIYPGEPCYGISPHILVQIRDYILWRFLFTPALLKEDLFKNIKITKKGEPPLTLEALESVLRTLAKPCPTAPGQGQYWQLMLPSEPLSNPRYQESIDRHLASLKQRYHGHKPSDLYKVS